jgi:Gas vesicle protein
VSQSRSPSRKPHKRLSPSDRVLETSESTLLDLVDRLLNKGVMATGDVTLGVAGIDLIYLRLSSILCAADRLMPGSPDAPGKRRRHHRNRLRKQS